MPLTQTAAQQASTVATEKTNKATALANFINAGGEDRARYLAEMHLADAKIRQALDSKPSG